MKNHFFQSVYITDLGITDTDNLDDIISKLPNSCTLRLWVNDSTTYGSQVRNEIGTNVYGHMFLHKTYDTETIYILFFSYQGDKIYFKTYSSVNDYGWSSYWRSVNLTNVNVE